MVILLAKLFSVLHQFFDQLHFTFLRDFSALLNCLGTRGRMSRINFTALLSITYFRARRKEDSSSS
jgi:hypothetical protein